MEGVQMNNHLGDTNKMVSDTPISDSTAHNVAELGMLCRRLERELNAANDRIKRMEEAGDLLTRMVCRQDGYGVYPDEEDAVNSWFKAKEAKP
jgi:hypothetical protein